MAQRMYADNEQSAWQVLVWKYADCWYCSCSSTAAEEVQSGSGETVIPYSGR